MGAIPLEIFAEIKRIQGETAEKENHAVESEDGNGRFMWPTPAASEWDATDAFLKGLVNKEGNPAQLGDPAFKPDTGHFVQITLVRAVRQRGYLELPEEKECYIPAKADERSAEDIADDGGGLEDTVVKKEVKPCVRAMLNPNWVDWLMGWPVGWTNPDPLPAGVLDEWVSLNFAGRWWEKEPPGIPRVTMSRRNRSNRLKADGNGQVSLCAAAACVALYRTTMQVLICEHILAERERNPISIVDAWVDGTIQESSKPRVNRRDPSIPYMSDAAKTGEPPPQTYLDFNDLIDRDEEPEESDDPHPD